MPDSTCQTRRSHLRALLGLFLIAFWPRASLGGRQTQSAHVFEAGEQQNRRSLLSSVRVWGCQFQNVDIAQITNSSLDLIVVDHALGDAGLVVANARDIETLKVKPDGGRRIVLAYLSVGEAEDYRPYWKAAWKKRPPAWLGPSNSAWPGAYKVKYWDPRWKEIVYKGEDSTLSRIIRAGFDGVFLDRVDGYLDWEPKRPAAPFEMIDFVSELTDSARTAAPNFLVVSQNSESLLRQRRFRMLIDGVSKESLLYGLSAPEARNSERDIAWSLTGLNAAHRDGIPIFAIEYLDDPEKIVSARQELKKMGFVPFFAKRELDQMPEG